MQLSHEACLSFDIACLLYDERLTQFLAETVEETIPEAELKKSPTRSVPAHDDAEIRRVLGLDASALDAPVAAVVLEQIEAQADELAREILRGVGIDWLGGRPHP